MKRKQKGSRCKKYTSRAVNPPLVAASLQNYTTTIIIRDSRYNHSVHSYLGRAATQSVRYCK